MTGAELITKDWGQNRHESANLVRGAWYLYCLDGLWSAGAARRNYGDTGWMLGGWAGGSIPLGLVDAVYAIPAPVIPRALDEDGDDEEDEDGDDAG